MSFEDTTRKMADEVAEQCRDLREDMSAKRLNTDDDPHNFEGTISYLSRAVEKLARCISRAALVDKYPTRALFPQVTSRPVPPARADGGLCRDCGGMTVPTGACSTCSVCGSTGGCG